MSPATADLVGDSSAFTTTSTKFALTIILKGKTGSIAVPFSTQRGVKEIISSRAFARIQTDTLACQVVSGVTSDKSYQVAVGFMPSDVNVLSASDLPTKSEDILLYPGSVALQRSELANPLVLGSFPAQVTNQLKPAQLGASPPIIVVHFSSEGTDTNSTAILRISGLIEATGIGFIKLH